MTSQDWITLAGIGAPTLIAVVSILVTARQARLSREHEHRMARDAWLRGRLAEVYLDVLTIVAQANALVVTDPEKAGAGPSLDLVEKAGTRLLSYGSTEVRERLKRWGELLEGVGAEYSRNQPDLDRIQEFQQQTRERTRELGEQMARELRGD